MAVIDVASKSITLKIVYYGCALGGKTTNLVSLHRLTDREGTQGLVSIATNDDRTLFFDLLPVDLGQIGGLSIKVKLYTVPGQVHYELTRRKVLQGADGVVLVVDSSPAAKKSNVWAAENLRYNLRANGLNPDQTPTVIQWNKRDLFQPRLVEELDAELNTRRLPTQEAVAKTGQGVLETFGLILRDTIAHAYARSPVGKVSEDEIQTRINQALTRFAGAELTKAAPQAPTFSHEFDIDAYRAAWAARGRDRRVMDQESLLSESLTTNMMLAERLESVKELESRGERRAQMMEALSQLTPLLVDSSGKALPAGALDLLLKASQRTRGSLLLFQSKGRVMEEHEVVPTTPDPLNAMIGQDGVSVAYRIARGSELQLIGDVVTELFHGAPPHEMADLDSVLVAPLGCDGLEFGAILVYGTCTETAFDATEQGFWCTASKLVGLSLHWHALRRKAVAASVG